MLADARRLDGRLVQADAMIVRHRLPAPIERAGAPAVHAAAPLVVEAGLCLRPRRSPLLLPFSPPRIEGGQLPLGPIHQLASHLLGLLRIDSRGRFACRDRLHTGGQVGRKKLCRSVPSSWLRRACPTR